jgi:hypothetical protein
MFSIEMPFIGGEILNAVIFPAGGLQSKSKAWNGANHYSA